jgi:hypothetical protein
VFSKVLARRNLSKKSLFRNEKSALSNPNFQFNEELRVTTPIVIDKKTVYRPKHTEAIIKSF